MPAQRNALGLPVHPHPQALKGRPKPAPVGEEVKGKRLEAIPQSQEIGNSERSRAEGAEARRKQTNPFNPV
jgi:hypothetical protein